MYIHECTVILIPESMHIHVHVVCEKIHMSTCSYEQYFHGAWSISQILYICEVMNRPEYMPQNPTYENLPNIYDTRFTTIQPYLHNVSSCTSTCTHMFSCMNKFHLSLCAFFWTYNRSPMNLRGSQWLEQLGNSSETHLLIDEVNVCMCSIVHYAVSCQSLVLLYTLFFNCVL